MLQHTVPKQRARPAPAAPAAGSFGCRQHRGGSGRPDRGCLLRLRSGRVEPRQLGRGRRGWWLSALRSPGAGAGPGGPAPPRSAPLRAPLPADWGCRAARCEAGLGRWAYLSICLPRRLFFFSGYFRDAPRLKSLPLSIASAARVGWAGAGGGGRAGEPGRAARAGLQPRCIRWGGSSPPAAAPAGPERTERSAAMAFGGDSRSPPPSRAESQISL